MSKTIPYVNGSINPIQGCVRYSRGCDNCYAHTWATRFRGGDFSLKYFPEKLDVIRRKTSGLWFVGSMTDLFQDGTSWHVLDDIFYNMKLSSAKFLILTKRAANMADYFILRTAPSNVGIGVTAEGQREWDERVPILLSIKAAMRWVSVEPMLENLPHPDQMARLSWVIAGPETGSHKRPFDGTWITSLRFLADHFGIPFFDKREGYHREWPKGWERKP